MFCNIFTNKNKTDSKIRWHNNKQIINIKLSPKKVLITHFINIKVKIVFLKTTSS